MTCLYCTGEVFVVRGMDGRFTAEGLQCCTNRQGRKNHEKACLIVCVECAKICLEELPNITG